MQTLLRGFHRGIQNLHAWGGRRASSRMVLLYRRRGSSGIGAGGQL